MRVQVVYKPRHFSYDLDWLDAFKNYAQASLHFTETRLNADLIVLHHSLTGQDLRYPEWVYYQLKNRSKGKVVVFHTNEFKFVREREQLAQEIHADFIATQLEDGRLYQMPTISMPHALNPLAFYDMGLRRTVSVGFRGARYKPGIHDARMAIVEAFKGVPESDIVIDKDAFLSRDEWARFLNTCKAIPGAEAGHEGGRIISPRHLEAVGCGTLQILLKGRFCGVLDESHYLPFTTVDEALEVVFNEPKRKEITERAFRHVIENHTYKHRVEKLLKAVE